MSGKKKDALIDAINQVFSLFRLNYHNQFYAAYNDSDTLNQAKKMWFESLKHLDTDTILRATKNVVESAEYLPTLHRFLSICDKLYYSLPSPRSAYEEACLATEPRENYAWSHPISYHAGKATGWFFLRSQPEYKTFPVFEKHYESIAGRIRQGEQFTNPEPLQIEHKKPAPLAKQEQKKRLKALRKALAL